jgi:antitoxin component YwqK of YwqJK toxin-antitoxin module
LHFTEGILTQKAYFKEGVKIGVWEKYDVKGKLIRKTTFDNKGVMIKEENLE